ncbi:MAG: LamG-like jellyroll fold domain-containing protein, partial [Terriglobales bacterium]
MISMRDEFRCVKPILLRRLLQRPLQCVAIAFCLLAIAADGHSQNVVTNDPAFYGPYNAEFLPDGDGLKKPLRKDDSVLRADLPWSLYGWVKPAEVPQAPTLVAGMGDPADEFSRYIAVDREHLILWMGNDNSISGPASFGRDKWYFVAAIFDGEKFLLYADGIQVAAGRLDWGTVSPVLQMAPAFLPASNWLHFGGGIAGLTLVRRALSVEEVQQLSHTPEDFSLVEFEAGSKPWPVETRGQAGYRAPQDPATLPRGRAPFSRPTATSPVARPSLQADGKDQWTLAEGWSMTPAPKVSADGIAISQASYRAQDWWPATVPGTALTTMIDRGVYPDPDYGLNNLAIPESLNKQDYWYRTEFRAPKSTAG